MRGRWLALALLLAGCAAAGNWTKPGADETAAGEEYQECRATAATAVRSDVDIDQDILASRGDDLQRASIGRVGAQNMQEHTRDRAAAIVDACMRAKGFAKPR